MGSTGKEITYTYFRIFLSHSNESNNKKKNPLKTLRYQKGWLLHYFLLLILLYVKPKTTNVFFYFLEKKRVSFRRWYQVDQNFTVYWWYWLYMQWDFKIYLFNDFSFKGRIKNRKDLLSWEMKLSIVYFVVKILCSKKGIVFMIYLFWESFFGTITRNEKGLLNRRICWFHKPLQIYQYLRDDPD